MQKKKLLKNKISKNKINKYLINNNHKQLKKTHKILIKINKKVK